MKTRLRPDQRRARADWSTKPRSSTPSDSVPPSAAPASTSSHTEPLPPGHPFYAHPGVLVTPHVSATTRRFWERETDLITENIGRFVRGEPLLNLVDKAAGY